MITTAAASTTSSRLIDPLSTLAQPFYDNNTIREYRYYRYRYGFAGGADYKLNDNNNFYAHGLYSDLKDWGDKWYYEPVQPSDLRRPACNPSDLYQPPAQRLSSTPRASAPMPPSAA